MGAAQEAIGQLRREFFRQARMAIAGHDELAAVREQGVEGVQELFLRRLLTRQEVQVIDQQGVALAEVPAERGQLAGTHRLHEAVGEILSGDVDDARLRAGATKAGVDAFKEVRLACADRTVQDEGIGRLARLLDDAQGGGDGDAVAWADDELG